MNIPRSDPSVTLLPNGTVLVIGGFEGGTKITDTAEIYDPASNTWTLTGSLVEAREAHTATLLPDGTVLVTGGQGDLAAETVRASSEIYDPATRTFAAVGAMGTGRYFHTASFLPASGLVLVASGLTAFDAAALTASVERYDIFVILATAQAVDVADPIVADRNSHSATTLADGTVLIAGGDDAGSTFYAAAEIYTPDAIDEPPVDEPPVDEPPVDEPPVDEPPVDEPPVDEPPVDEPLPALTFADFADLPIPGLTLIATEVPPGLSLVSLTGIIPLLAAIEAAELSAAQGEIDVDFDDGDPIIEGDGGDDLSTFLDEKARIGTDILVRDATIGIDKVFNPADGNSFAPDGLPFLNLFTTAGVGPIWVNAPNGGWVVDAFWSDEQWQTIPPHTGRSSPFVPIAYTGPATQPNLAALGLDGADVPAVFAWEIASSSWKTFRPGGPKPTQTLDDFGDDALMVQILDERPVELHIAPPDQTFGERCDSIVYGTGDAQTVLTNPEGNPGTTPIDIELLLSLSLVSAAPIVVTFAAERWTSISWSAWAPSNSASTPRTVPGPPAALR